MEMELMDLLRVLRRWAGLIILIVLATAVVLGLQLRLSGPVYRTWVALQLTIPQSEDVAAFDQYRYTSERDEITVARNNFIKVLESDEVRDRTINALSLGAKDATYSLGTQSVSDSDFVYVSVDARTSKLAADIANTHVAQAIQQYGELRAKPTDAEKVLFAAQAREAEQELRAADGALAEFKAQGGVASLEDDVATYQRLLEELQLERDKRLLEASADVLEDVSPSANPGASGSSLDPTADVDKLIAQREAELARLVALGPAYRLLEDNVVQARAKYQHMQEKYNEAAIKAAAVRAANFIQIVGPAKPPSAPVSNRKWLLLAITGSLGGGVLLAFLLDYVSRFRRHAPEPAGAPLPDRPPKTPRKRRPAPSAIVVNPSASLEAPVTSGSDQVPALDGPAAPRAATKKQGPRGNVEASR